MEKQSLNGTAFPAALSPVPIVTHLHGGEVESASDGNPEAWFTPGNAIIGPKFVKSTYNYPNTQQPATLWYHNHTLGITRQNVYAGLAGFYFLKDPADVNAALLPSGAFDVPLLIQDRAFVAPATLNTIPVLTANAPARVLTLNEFLSPVSGAPLSVHLNGQSFEAPGSEFPRVGSTETWDVVNTTADTHPIHLHLVQFQVLSRRPIDTVAYTAAWSAVNGQGVLPLTQSTVAVSPTPYLTKGPRGRVLPAITAPANERGWKDTVRMNPGEVTRISACSGFLRAGGL